MGLEIITAVFEADDSLLLVLSKNKDAFLDKKDNWELPRIKTRSVSEEDLKKAFSETYGLSKESLKIVMLDKARNFVYFNYIENPNKIFDRFDLSMIKIDPSLYKSCVFTGKTEARQLMIPEDRDLLNSYS